MAEATRTRRGKGRPDDGRSNDHLFDRELDHLPPEVRWREWMNRVEATIFAASEPIGRETLAKIVGKSCSIDLLIDDIREERSLLETTREKADFIIDTTSINGRELQEEIRKFSHGFVGPRAMSVVFVSFGFKHGVPLDCDLVFDVRFLPNPFYIASLKTLTGVHKEVYDYVFSSDTAKQYAQKLKDFIEFQIPLFISEPKTRLQIGIGCTGGRHRSVAFAEYLFKEIANERISTSKIHRDLNL